MTESVDGPLEQLSGKFPKSKPLVKCFRIDSKVLLLVFRCLNGLGPSYLSLYVTSPCGP